MVAPSVDPFCPLLNSRCLWFTGGGPLEQAKNNSPVLFPSSYFPLIEDPPPPLSQAYPDLDWKQGVKRAGSSILGAVLNRADPKISVPD